MYTQRNVQLRWQLQLVIASLFLAMIGWMTQAEIARADDAVAPQATNAIYLPLVAGQATTAAQPTVVLTPTPTVAATPMPTPTTPAQSLPDSLVATWYSGNAPLNDFYNPQTGEWRDVNGLGQMVVFGADGAYTYTGFLRLQQGTCRTEVSTYKLGTAAVSGATLTLNPQLVKTRTVVVCGNVDESLTEGPYDPVVEPWQVVEQDNGHLTLTVGAGESETEFYKAGMVASLVGEWQNMGLSSINFYNPTTDTFDLASGEGMWFDFTAVSTYRFGEHSHNQPDEQGCFYEWWTYQVGTIDVVGGRITITPETGSRRYINSCAPDQPVQEEWLDDARDYTWFYRDRATDSKLVLIPLERFVEFIFQQP